MRKFKIDDMVQIVGSRYTKKVEKGTLIEGFDLVDELNGDNIDLLSGDTGIIIGYDSYDNYYEVKMESGDYEGCIIGVDEEDLVLLFW